MQALQTVEDVTVAIFTVELLARLLTAHAVPQRCVLCVVFKEKEGRWNMMDWFGVNWVLLSLERGEIGFD